MSAAVSLELQGGVKEAFGALLPVVLESTTTSAHQSHPLRYQWPAFSALNMTPAYCQACEGGSAVFPFKGEEGKAQTGSLAPNQECKTRLCWPSQVGPTSDLTGTLQSLPASRFR